MAFSIENRAMRAGDIVERITPKTNPAEIDWAHIKDTYHSSTALFFDVLDVGRKFLAGMSSLFGAGCASVVEGYCYFPDADGDGFGDELTELSDLKCFEDDEIPAGYSPSEDDCNDDNALVNPGEPEVYDDGLDNNCDGVIDTDDVPTQLTPSNGLILAPTRAFLSWEAGTVPNGKTIATHHVCYTQDATAIDEDSECANESNETQTFRVIDPLTSSASHYWKVQTCYTDSSCSDYSPVWSFSTDDSLVGWWKFDDGTADDSIGAYDGTLTNGAIVSDTVGMVGGALTLDGVNDYMLVPDNDVFDFGTGSFTLTAWINPDSMPGEGYVYNIISKNAPDGEGGRQYGLSIPSNGSLSIYAYPSCGEVGGGSVTSGEWHYTVATYNSSDLVLYLDSQEVGAETCVLDIYNSASLTIGHESPEKTGASNPFNGLIDEVAIYDEALSSEAILNSYCAIEALAGADPLPEECL